jgi:glycogen(starch) synthase
VRILVLSQEYPPLGTGGIAAHVDGLTRALARAGHEVVVLTYGVGSLPSDDVRAGVRVLRADTSFPWLPDDEVVAQHASNNHQLVGLLARLGDGPDGTPWRPDVVHGHDWPVAWAAAAIATLHGVPMVATLHGTERGRHGGHLPPGLPGAINSIEWWLTYSARRVICCSRFMVREVVGGFELPFDKVHLVPNGIEVATWAPPSPLPDDERRPIVFTWGRVQYEKGFQVLARAMDLLRTRLPGASCVIAGRGSYLPELQSQIDIEGATDLVTLAGYMPEPELREAIHRATCVVIPSLYEPFGIVALESLAAGAALIVARTGGLAEVIEGTGAGLLFEPGNAAELADRIEQVFTDPDLARSMRQRAASLLGERYSWDAIAAATVDVYGVAQR